MKLNSTPRHYMPLPQNQSDDDESGPIKEVNREKLIFKNSFDASERLSKRIRQACTDDIDPKNLPMSPMRLLLFIISLIMCVLFVVIFVFFVPCTMSQNLNGTGHLTYLWRKEFLNMSFTPPLDYAFRGALRSRIVILGYVNEESGLIAFHESNGQEVWRLHLHSSPISSSCNSIDVNSDGVPECLVIGNNGLLAAIDVKNGISLWYLHNHSDLNEAYSIDGPIIVPDYDEDGIEDIVISYNMNRSDNVSHLALVSGGTGQIIGSLIELPHCKELAKMYFTWESQNETYFTLHCTGEENGNLLLLSSRDVFDTVLNETDSLSMHYIFRVPHFVQNIEFFKVTSSRNQIIIILDGVKFMLLEISSHLDSQIVWESDYLHDQPMRILVDGLFTNGSNEMIITGSNLYHSKVMGISLTDGKEMWSFIHDNGCVTSATKLPNFFGDVDGLVLKTLTPAVFDYQVSNESFGNASSDQSTQDFQRNLLKDNLKSFEESYLLVMGGKVPIVKTLVTEEVKVICKSDGVCHPNVYFTNSSVLIKESVPGNAFDMITVTSTVLPINNAEKILIKHLHLENFLTRPTCGS